MGRKKECLLIENEQHHYFAETASSSSAHTFFSFLKFGKNVFSLSLHSARLMISRAAENLSNRYNFRTKPQSSKNK